MIFPQYRKYVNDKSFFEIQSDKILTEYQVIGSKFMVHTLEAKILPEFQLIADTLACEHGRWVEISKPEFDAAILDLQSNKTKL